MAQKRLKYADLAQATSTDQLNSFIARNLRTVCQNRTESCSCCPSSPSLCSGPPSKKQKTRDDASTPSLSYVSWVCPTPPPQTPLPPLQLQPDAILILYNLSGQCSGEAFVTFPSEELARQAVAERSSHRFYGQQVHLALCNWPAAPADPPGPLYTDLLPLSSALTAGPSAPPQRQSRHPFRKKTPLKSSTGPDRGRSAATPEMRRLLLLFFCMWNTFCSNCTTVDPVMLEAAQTTSACYGSLLPSKFWLLTPRTRGCLTLHECASTCSCIWWSQDGANETK